MMRKAFADDAQMYNPPEEGVVPPVTPTTPTAPVAATDNTFLWVVVAAVAAYFLFVRR